MFKTLVILLLKLRLSGILYVRAGAQILMYVRIHCGFALRSSFKIPRNTLFQKKSIILTFLLVFSAFAEDKGCFGEVFEIAETDLIEDIKLKLLKLNEAGEIEKTKKKIQQEVVKNIENPRPLSNIIHTKKPRKYEFDPTIEVTIDLKDNKGKIFAKKGDRYNPLDYVSLTKSLLFIDGVDENHIEWAKLKLLKHSNAKIILVNGNPLKLQERLGIQIFFDQYGTITKKLGIKQVPAIVYQEKGEKVLTVKEEIAK